MKKVQYVSFHYSYYVLYSYPFTSKYNKDNIIKMVAYWSELDACNSAFQLIQLCKLIHFCRELELHPMNC